MEYHFFIPGSNPVEGIYWVGTIKEFQAMARLKSEIEPGYRWVSDAEDVRCMVLNPETLQADYYSLSELMMMSSDKLDEGRKEPDTIDD